MGSRTRDRTVEVFDSTPCRLGEGPFWHPERQQLFWFDILGRRLLTRSGSETQVWQFAEHVSAAGWIDRDRLLIASETALFSFDVTDGTRHRLTPLEADNPRTRSNDGRADPWGGFWIGTMGKSAEPEAGSIWRYYRGELRRLVPGLTISNAICFSPDRSFAYYTDTTTRQIMRQPLDPQDGWPDGLPRVWLNLNEDCLNPDGAVIDARGNMWLAQWGASRVACHNPQGRLIEVVDLPAPRVSCPAFGGKDMRTLFITTAIQGFEGQRPAAIPEAGRTYRVEVAARGQQEHRVIA
ncbi:gluconolactonase [Brevirhabdus pacifica]|uniref:Gluconolactonase n=2 Tax=Brevirhabdus pacifica TaxID=1267768 RepID=A0A1U7DHF2_9RHOB|nr:SMP-30/gluconolactonase/LRE family protein [Brevirhabdus pacifica]APX89412.1 gluconolactonase [Brevirhabdus pacifica]OWU76565.1 gluconolactonase [Loktanella sp. 22II-4b]PJJ85945.1 sugar lactone lactonase YvrE [Brevirhabdus pacifica]